MPPGFMVSKPSSRPGMTCTCTVWTAGQTSHLHSAAGQTNPMLILGLHPARLRSCGALSHMLLHLQQHTMPQLLLAVISLHTCVCVCRAPVLRPLARHTACPSLSCSRTHAVRASWRCSGRPPARMPGHLILCHSLPAFTACLQACLSDRRPSCLQDTRLEAHWRARPRADYDVPVLKAGGQGHELLGLQRCHALSVTQDLRRHADRRELHAVRGACLGVQ
jgi:hypothetical protein